MAKTDTKIIDILTSLSKRRGFIFQSSEIYGGLASTWDYGPLGVELKRNIKDLWWKSIVTANENVVGMDAAILMHPKVWEASGHVENFHDPLIDNKETKKRYRVDHLFGAQEEEVIESLASKFKLDTTKYSNDDECFQAIVSSLIEDSNSGKIMKECKVIDPFNKKMDQGAIVSLQHLNKILRYVKHAKKEGGTILTGGDIPKTNEKCSSGWYFSPTVIENLSDNSILNQEEIFGPVVTLNTFKDENEVIKMANNTDYGLAAIIWTNDMNRAQKLAEVVESGLVWINCWLERDLRTPFGGIKNSGFGKEWGMYALDFFTEPKNICIKYYD